MKKTSMIFSMAIALLFLSANQVSAANLCNGDIEEGFAKQMSKKADSDKSKFEKNQGADFAPIELKTASDYIDKANKYIQEEEWAVACYFASKARAFIELGYAVKAAKKKKAELKHLKARQKAHK